MQEVKKTIFFDVNNIFMIEHDYVESFKAELDMEIKPEAFFVNHTISIEGITCEYYDKDYNDVSNEEIFKMDLHPHFTNDSTQNAATECEYMKDFIHWMYE